MNHDGLIVPARSQADVQAVQDLARACGVYVPSGAEDVLLVAVQADAVVGFAAWQCVLDEATLLGIAVAAQVRRQGLGARLLQAGFACLPQAKTLFLEVRADNDGAIALYGRLGFAYVARRKGYYGDADALVLRALR